MAGGNSTAATLGSGSNQYPSNGEKPFKGCDNDVTTKSLNFGPCNAGIGSAGPLCGLDTGIYIIPTRSASLAVGLQLCTGDDAPERDPITITLEGSNAASVGNLILGSSWTLTYNGTTGLDVNPNRTFCGPIVRFPNTVWYKSYRMLITAKRADATCTQFSEFKLLGT